ncbi:hypothetical protein Tco_1387874, partial [Tanacetum coccineum]
MATKPLDADLCGTPLAQTKYHSMVGALIYLTASRPDIVHATCYCARYQARPTEKHPKEDRAGCPDSLKSTSGGIENLGGDKLVRWSSKKQDLIMEYLVNISKKRAFWSLNEDILKIYYSDYQYAVSIKEDTAYPCLHSPKTTKETCSIR